MNFTASSNNIVRNYYQENNQGASMVDKSRDIWDGLWDIGDPNRHFQSLTLNYKLPLKYIPFLSFIDANYSYTGDFSWQRGSNALADVQDIDGNVLGIVNTVQNANTQTLNGSISMSKIYRLFGIQNREQKLRKILTSKNTLTPVEETKKSPKEKEKNVTFYS